MKFSDIALALGIENYPERFESLLQEVQSGRACPVTAELIRSLQEKYQLFRDYYDGVMAGFEDLQKKEAERLFVSVGSLYLTECTQKEAIGVPLPDTDGSPARDLIPLFLLLCRVEGAIANYEKRGFSHQEAVSFMKNVASDIGVYVRNCGRVGLSRTYYNWLSLIMWNLLFPCEGFKLNFSTVNKNVALLHNKNSGEYKPVSVDRVLHASGHVLGSAGFEDEKGSFLAEFKETDTEWIGYAAADNGLFETTPRHFSKSEWELVAKGGDFVLNIHIPRGADISLEKLSAAALGGIQYAEKYEGKTPAAIHCSSWMLNPEYAEILGEDSRIALFGGAFHRYPVKNDGKGVYNFVFQSPVVDPHTLPENTRLQRACKARLLTDKPLLNFSGFYIPKKS